jgi:hypothetical protein
VQERRAGHILQVPNSLLCHPILEVSVDPTIRDFLSLIGYVLEKQRVGKPTVVRMIVKHLHTMGLAESLESSFGSNSVIGGEGPLQVHE